MVAPNRPFRPSISSTATTNWWRNCLPTTGSFRSFHVCGGIEIDDRHDLQYVLVDNTGASTGKSITVYGDLSFAENTNHLSIALAGGGVAEIQGLTGVQSLQAEKNHIPAFRADDL